jgi:hypothetical protein
MLQRNESGCDQKYRRVSAKTIRLDMMMDTAELYDGCLPTTLVAGSAPGESGVSVLGLRCGGDSFHR